MFVSSGLETKRFASQIRVFLGSKTSHAGTTSIINEWRVAKEGLVSLCEDLEAEEIQAANSVREGLQETLTLHRLGMADKLCKSLDYTNIVENLKGSMKARLGKIRRGTDSNHYHRWIAVATTECESKRKKIKNANYSKHS